MAAPGAKRIPRLALSPLRLVDEQCRAWLVTSHEDWTGETSLNLYPHQFEGVVEHHFVGTLRYTVIFLPAELASELPFSKHPRLRASGEINDVPFSAAWQPVRGRWYMMLSKGPLRDAELSVGDRADVRFRVEDPDSVEVPIALTDALVANASAGAAWARLSAGKRRGFAHLVSSAKTAPTQQRRLAEVLLALETGDHSRVISPKARRKSEPPLTIGDV